MELRIRGEIVKIIENDKQPDKDGKVFSRDYIIIKHEAKTRMHDYFPIEVYSPKTGANLMKNLKTGYVVYAYVDVECKNFKDNIEIREYMQNSGVKITTPMLFPKLRLRHIDILEETPF